MKKLNSTIKFQTASFKHEVVCVWKGLGYDVYLCGKCIKVNANIEEIQMLYRILTEEL